MKRIVIVLVISLLFLGCRKEVSAAEISKINGYWEIEKVIFANGNVKDYTINETFDYFSIKRNVGFRKKVTPQLDGTFLVNDSFEKVTINNIKDSYFLNYTTPFAKWREELLVVSDKELVIRNNAKDEYHYKRTAPINLKVNVEKNQ